MTRLVNAMRDGIVDRLMEHTFNERIKSLHKMQANVAAVVYYDVYDDATCKRMQALPDGWLPTDDDIRVKSAAETVSLNFDGNYSLNGPWGMLHDRNTNQIERRFPWCDKGKILKVYDGGTPIAEEITDLGIIRDGLIREMSEARKRAAATLESIHTVEKLIEQWPEIEPFIDEADRPTPVTALVIPTDQLNVLFRLPAVAAA